MGSLLHNLTWNIVVILCCIDNINADWSLQFTLATGEDILTKCGLQYVSVNYNVTKIQITQQHTQDICSCKIRKAADTILNANDQPSFESRLFGQTDLQLQLNYSAVKLTIDSTDHIMAVQNFRLHTDCKSYDVICGANAFVKPFHPHICDQMKSAILIGSNKQIPENVTFSEMNDLKLDSKRNTAMIGALIAIVLDFLAIMVLIILICYKMKVLCFQQNVENTSRKENKAVSAEINNDVILSDEYLHTNVNVLLNEMSEKPGSGQTVHPSSDAGQSGSERYNDEGELEHTDPESVWYFEIFNQPQYVNTSPDNVNDPEYYVNVKNDGVMPGDAASYSEII